MNSGFVIVLVALLLLFVAVRLIKPVAPGVSAFEIKRLAGEGDRRAMVWRERLRVAPFLLALRSFASLLVVYGIYGVLGILLNGWAAAALTIALVLGAAWATRIRVVSRLRERLYERLEPRLLKLWAARRWFFFLPPAPFAESTVISSEPELVHAISRMRFLGEDRRSLIRSALEFTGLSVRDGMSGRRAIHAVDKGEVLGPLVLDGLYKTGRRTFVVTDGSLDAVIGVLHLDRLTNLTENSPTALNAMSPDVAFIDADAPITDGLAYLRSSKAPFLVVQDDGRTVGLLGMDNILRCLFEAE